MTCDHGIAMDRYCDLCEVPFREEAPMHLRELEQRHRSGLIAALSILTALALIALPLLWAVRR